VNLNDLDDVVPLEEDEPTLAPRTGRSARPSPITETQRALGRALRSRALHEGLTCPIIAERAGIDQSTVKRLFGGRGGSWDTVERIARVLRTTISAALQADYERPGRSR
jgi:hypothetical protein